MDTSEYTEIQPDDNSWTFSRPEDVLQFAHDSDEGFSKLNSFVIMDLFNESACEYDTPYSSEDRALVDFYDALMAAWQANA